MHEKNDFEFIVSSSEGEEFRLSQDSRVLKLPYTWLDGNTPVWFMFRSRVESRGVKYDALSSRPRLRENYLPSPFKYYDESRESPIILHPEIQIYDHEASIFDVRSQLIALRGGFMALSHAGIEVNLVATLIDKGAQEFSKPSVPVESSDQQVLFIPIANAG